MATPREKVSTVDPIWTALRQQAEAMAGRELHKEDSWTLLRRSV